MGATIWKDAARHPRGRGRIAPHPEVVKQRAALTRILHGKKLSSLKRTTPATYDCRTIKVCTQIWDQGQCGNCYIFSGSDVCANAQLVAGIASLASNPAFGLSQQELMDCHSELGGCDGGDEWQVAQLILQQGLSSNTDYPGLGQVPGNCGTVTDKYKIDAIGYCDPNQQANGVASTDLIKQCIMEYGPVSVAVAAGSWGDPGSSVITGNDTSVDHAIQIIGWDDSKQAWILKNQWSTNWGINGFAWIGYGADSVGTEAFWAQVTPVGPSPSPSPSPTGGAPIAATIAAIQADPWFQSLFPSSALSPTTTIAQLIEMVGKRPPVAPVPILPLLEELLKFACPFLAALPIPAPWNTILSGICASLAKGQKSIDPHIVSLIKGSKDSINSLPAPVQNVAKQLYSACGGCGCN